MSASGEPHSGLLASVNRWLLAPGRGVKLGLILVLCVMGVVYFLPVLSLFARSFTDADTGGFTLKLYQDLIERPTTQPVLWNTIRLSIEGTVATLFLAYPLAYMLATRENQTLVFAMIPIIIIPYFTSGLVRTFAWIILLGRNGLVNNTLMALGITGQPLTILYNEFATVIGLVYYFLPLTVLVLYAVMRGVDLNLTKAAAVCGAGPFTAFRRVYLPLTIPGIVSASILSIVSGLGSYVTPALMGGSGQVMWAQKITQELDLYGTWGHAAVLGVVLAIMVVATFVIAERLFHVTKIFEAPG